MRPEAPGRRAQRGFTLLEVLVAFAIAAVALGVLVDGTLTGMRGARLAARQEEALSHARSRLAALGQGEDLTPGENSGDSGGGFSYRRRVSRVATTQAADTALYEISLSIGWVEDGRTRTVQLATRRIGPGSRGGP
jgi:general secretion pathway protein I